MPAGAVVPFHDAYLFEIAMPDTTLEGIVFKRRPRRVTWEARIDGTEIQATDETRLGAVRNAYEEFNRSDGPADGAAST